jgi:phosphate transport system substrate-binding protein
MKAFMAIVVILAVGILLFGCASQQGTGQNGKKEVKITGSDTMVILGQAWAESYMDAHPDERVSVTGGGSGVGITSIIEGTTDIAQASRDMKASEIEKARANGANPVKTIVAYDGIAMIVNPSNQIEQLTMDQLGKIFKGEVKNWKEVGGSDSPIGIYSRESSSGTYEFMKEHVLKNADYASSAKYSSGNSAIVESISQDKTGIGYVGVAYAKQRADVKILKISKDSSSFAYFPTKETVKSGEYPIARSLNFYTDGEPSGEVKAFIDFVLGSEGKAIVAEMGYFE